MLLLTIVITTIVLLASLIAVALYDYSWRLKIRDMADERYKDFLWHLHGMKIKDGALRNNVIDDYIEFIKDERADQKSLIHSKFSKKLTDTYYDYFINLLEKLKG
jgi:hypothetical protein